MRSLSESTEAVQKSGFGKLKTDGRLRALLPSGRPSVHDLFPVAVLRTVIRTDEDCDNFPTSAFRPKQSVDTHGNWRVASANRTASFDACHVAFPHESKGKRWRIRRYRELSGRGSLCARSNDVRFSACPPRSWEAV